MATAGANFQTLNRRRLVDEVTEQLRDLIISNVLTPGQRLHQQELAAKLGISRTPLREAFRILEHEGLIRTSKTSHTVEVQEFHDDDIREYYEIREFVDGLATRLAASRNQPKQTLTRLSAASHIIADAVDPFDVSKFLKGHVAFHLGLIEASGNSRLSQFEFVVTISAQMLYLRLSSNPERMVRSSHEHEEILDAVVRRDPDAAEELARRHIRLALESWSHSSAQSSAS